MQILGVEGMTVEQVHRELARGGKFVLFEYCISVIILTFKRPSDIYFIRAGESAAMKSLQFTALSLVAGWWGFPWGPIYTISSVVTNLGGGRDVTSDVMRSLV
jgi:hypothetical protein